MSFFGDRKSDSFFGDRKSDFPEALQELWNKYAPKITESYEEGFHFLLLPLYEEMMMSAQDAFEAAYHLGKGRGDDEGHSHALPPYGME